MCVCECVWVPVHVCHVCLCEGVRDNKKNVCMYFSPFYRGIILTFVLVSCTQRTKLYNSAVPLFGP